MTESGSLPSTWKLVKVPAIITLIVTVVRLIGELAELSPTFFSSEPGGGLAVVGISWLVLIFGFYFGWRLARAGRAPEVPGRAMITILGGIVVAVVLFLVVMGVPEEGEPVNTNSMMIFQGGAWVCSLAVLFAWLSLFRVLLLYGLVARIPVILVTLLAVTFGWETHHVGGMPEMEGLELALFASLPQIGFWIPFTVLVGGLFGGFGALLGRRRQSDPA